MNPVQASLKADAISGIIFTWINFTIEVFKFSWHIISTSPREETYKPLVKLVCKNCGEFYEDDEERHAIDGVLLCEFCHLKK